MAAGWGPPFHADHGITRPFETLTPDPHTVADRSAGVGYVIEKPVSGIDNDRSCVFITLVIYLLAPVALLYPLRIDPHYRKVDFGFRRRQQVRVVISHAVVVEDILG